MKIVFWDWNGTLVNDAPILCEAFNRVAVPRGVSMIPLERYREIFRHPVREMYEELGIDFGVHCFEQLAHDWHEAYESQIPQIALHDDSLMTLEALHKRGSRQMILSALPQNMLEHSVRSFAVEPYFEHVFGASDKHGSSKVAEGWELMRTLGAKPSDVTIIGDSSHDAEVAQELKTSCILVARGVESRRRLEAHGYPVFESFESLVEQPSV
jgi:phosphoglycolate phosphatase